MKENIIYIVDIVSIIILVEYIIYQIKNKKRFFMKENNSPLENLKDEHKMLLIRDRIRQNKWIKRLCNKTLIQKGE